MKELLLIAITTFIHFLLVTFVDLIEPWILNSLDAFNRRFWHRFHKHIVDLVKLLKLVVGVEMGEVDLFLFPR